MAEKTSQTLPLDCDNMRTKCPCCGSLMKLVINWRSEGLHFELLPSSSQDNDTGGDGTGGHCAIMSQTNSSLMNIVSVSSAENLLKDQTSDSSKSVGVHNPHSNTAVSSVDDDSHGPQINDSNSSSLSPSSLAAHSSGSNRRHLLHSPVGVHRQSIQKCESPAANTSCHSRVGQSVSDNGPKFDPNSQSNLKIDLTAGSQVLQAFHNYLPVTRFPCEFNGCGLSFDNNQQLDLHHKEHKGEKIQKCDWSSCNRLFSSKEKLRNHVRCRHTGERPFKCIECGKAFTSPKHLKDHSLLHTDERPFGCHWEGCGQKFRRRHHLVAHERTHTKERPFICYFPGCEQRFTKSHHVKRHYETHVKYNNRTPVLSSAATNGLSIATPVSLVSSAPSPTSVPGLCSPLSSGLIGGFAFPAM